MSIAEAGPARRASSTEIVLWGLVVVVAGVMPGLGLAVGLALALTRLREHRVARVALPLLGAAATVLWALGLLAAGGGSDVGPPLPA